MSRYRGPKLKLLRRFGKDRYNEYKVELPGLTTKPTIKKLRPGKSTTSETKNQKLTESCHICL